MSETLFVFLSCQPLNFKINQQKSWMPKPVHVTGPMEKLFQAEINIFTQWKLMKRHYTWLLGIS